MSDWTSTLFVRNALDTEAHAARRNPNRSTAESMARPLRRRVHGGQVCLVIGAVCVIGSIQLALHDWAHTRQAADGAPALAARRSLDEIRRTHPPQEVWASGPRWERNATTIRATAEGLTVEERDQLTALCGRCLWHSLQTCVRVHGLGHTAFVATGDIDDMWLRDSSVQLAIYLPRLRRHPALRGIFEGMLRSQAFFILQDPYANAFKPRWRSVEDWPDTRERATAKGGWVAERKYELDSGAYFLSALHNYFATPGLANPAALLQEPSILEAAWTVVRTVAAEVHHHNGSSPYRFSELPQDGYGAPTGYTGMSWSAFRPSDDGTQFGYNVPGNMYAVAALERVAALDRAVWRDDDFHRAATDLAATIRAGIERHGIVQRPDGSRVYAYEVDGLGGVLSGFDDPNMPSLLGLPLLGYKYYDAGIYAATRAAILAPDNPLYFRSPEGAPPMEGLGSQHTPPAHVWPLAMMVQGLTTQSAEERITMLRRLLQLQCGNGLMHESVNVRNLNACTRAWFEWANAMLVVFVENALGADCEAAAEEHRLQGIREREAKAGGVQGDPAFYETLEASVRHVWVHRSSYETYEQALGLGGAGAGRGRRGGIIIPGRDPQGGDILP